MNAISHFTAYPYGAAMQAKKPAIQFGDESAERHDSPHTRQVLEDLDALAKGIDSKGVPMAIVRLIGTEEKAFAAILSRVHDIDTLKAVVQAVENPSGPFAGYPLIQSDLKSLVIAALLVKLSAR